jgi:hypothetical protein
VIEEGALTTYVAVVVPKSTAVAPVRLVPVMVTEEPPAVEPEAGLTPVTVGADTKVKASAALVVEVPPPVVTNTIKTQTQVLYRKLHANSRRDALLAASALQLFEPGRPGQDVPPLAALP